MVAKKKTQATPKVAEPVAAPVQAEVVEAPAPTPAENLAKANADAVALAVGPEDGPMDESKIADEAAAEGLAELRAELAGSSEVEPSEAILLATKEKMKADFMEQNRSKVLADMQAEALKDAKDKLEAEAEAEAKAKVEAEKVKVEDPDLWKTKPNKEIRRVFRPDKFTADGAPIKENLMTRQRQKYQVGEEVIDPFAKNIKPNPQGNYVLMEGAIDYSHQLAALRKLEKRGEIVEMPPITESVPFICEKAKKVKAAQDELDRLLAM